MELSSLVIAALFEAGVAHIFRTGLGTIACAVFNYAPDCWQIPRFVALGLTSRMVFVVSLKWTARQNSQLCVIILSALSFIVAWTFPVASLQPGPNSAGNLATRTHIVRFLHCDIG